MELLITDFGAKADGTLTTEAINQAISKAAGNGGGKVVIPAGEFYTGAIILKSNVELFLSSGSVLKFSDNQDDYPVVTSRWEGVKREVYASCIYAEDAKNISVTGFGLLNGNGDKWWHHPRDDRENLHYARPKLVSFDSCENVTLRDFSIIDSPSWTINPILCHGVTVDNIKIKNPADSPNTDGIDPESCKNVRISNCQIDVGDDCIAIKAGTEDTLHRVSCENITITNCQMVHGHGGVVIGSEMSGDIRNVTISNCVFQETDRGIRLKTRRGRGGIVEDIRVNNIVMDHVLCPFILNLYYFCGPKGKEKYVWDKAPYPITEETPMFRRIHFANITARNVHASAGFIYGLPEQPISEISFQNINISMAEHAIPGKPAMMTGIEEMAKNGFYIGCAKDISFDHVTVDDIEGTSYHVEDSSMISWDFCKVNGQTYQKEVN